MTTNIDNHSRYDYWRTADGRSVLITEMDDGHLVNVINWILDNPLSYSKSTLNKMIQEAKNRQTVLFAQGKPFPQQVKNKWLLIDPSTGEGHIIPPPKEYIEAVESNERYQAMFKRTQEKRKKQ